MAPLSVLTLLYVWSLTGWARADGSTSEFWDMWVYNVVACWSCVVIAARAALAPRLRWVAVCMTAAVGSWVAGNLVWTVSVRFMADPPFPSWADAGYLSFYPPAVLAILLMGRRWQGRWRDPVLLIDGLVGGLSGAAVVAVFALGPIAKSATGSRSAIITNLAYPVFDMILISLLLTVAGLAGWRLDRSQLLLAGSLALFAVADSLYLVRVATDSYVSGTLLDAGWLVPIVAMTWSVWLDEDDRQVSVAPTHDRAVWVPMALIGLAVAVCGWYTADDMPVMASIALAAALVAAGARMTTTLREMERLSASERQAREGRIQALARARDEVTHANADLERRVQERTADLAAANRQLSGTAERLRRSNRELQEFAYVASHDLQEPLRKVQAFGSRLADRYADVLDDPGRDYLDRMQGAAVRMSTLIDDLLTFSRVSTAAGVMRQVDLAQIAAEVVADLEIAVEQSHAEITIGALPCLEADPTQMRQLFQNLIGNALKFRRPEQAPRVVISSRMQEMPTLHTPSTAAERAPSETDGSPGNNGDGMAGESANSAQQWVVQISDNGIGFEEQFQERIFSVFQRLHGRSEYSGSGIGLSVCRRIVERHHGQITATSTPGEGSTFTVVLPPTQPQENQADDQPAQLPQPAQSAEPVGHEHAHRPG